jgi:hypothetical protein
MPTSRRSTATLNVVSSDDLSTMSDNELQYRANRLYDELWHAGPAERQRNIEIELAYCQREIDIRVKTYELHTEYLTNLAAQDSEENITVHA